MNVRKVAISFLDIYTKLSSDNYDCQRVLYIDLIEYLESLEETWNSKN